MWLSSEIAMRKRFRLTPAIVTFSLLTVLHKATTQQHVNGLSSGAPSERSRCAVIVTGLEPSFNNHNGEVCITYDDVNAAFNAAKNDFALRGPSKSLTDVDIDNLANVLVEVTRILTKKFNLPHDAINNALPLIDTRKTIIDQYCPAYLKKPKCEIRRYREYNGLCNNLENPHWGATLTSLRRMLPPAYADGISAPRVASDGDELPTARYVSSEGHRDLGYHDHAVTLFLPAWGQLIDHDMTLTAESKDPTTNKEPGCCDVLPNKRHPACWPIDIPSSDSFYSLFRRTCMDFVRSGAGLQGNCKLGPRIQMNLITSVLDASFVYGSSKEVANDLRTFKGGLLKSTPFIRERGMKDLLPLQLEDPDSGCLRPNQDMYCFKAGDHRVNQQMLLSVPHTLMMREHNRIATELGRINPHWNDERIYQETRHIVAALVQKITYNEFLPMVLGKNLMERYGIVLQRQGYYNGYDPKADPSMPNEFISAAFRFGHSLLPSAIERWSVTHKYASSRRLSDMLRKPFSLYEAGTCDQYLTGFMNQVSQALDDSVTQELTNHLFQDPDKRWGFDLASLNMQRGRDHGIPSYNAVREYCGLSRARTWNDLAGTFNNDTLARYSQVYRTPDDVDLWSAGISERPLKGSMVGPTFGCVIGETFKNLRNGDRFWFENSGWPSAFTPEQLAEIQKVKLSRLVCDNSDHIETVQVYVMVLPSPQVNPRVACKNSILPRMDLTKWKEADPSLLQNTQTYANPTQNAQTYQQNGAAIYQQQLPTNFNPPPVYHSTPPPTFYQNPPAPVIHQNPPSPTFHQGPPSSNIYQAPLLPAVHQVPAPPTVHQAPVPPTVYQAPAHPSIYQATLPPAIPQNFAPTAYQAPLPPTVYQNPAPPTVYQDPPSPPVHQVPLSSVHQDPAPPIVYQQPPPPTAAPQIPLPPTVYQAPPSPPIHQTTAPAVYSPPLTPASNPLLQYPDSYNPVTTNRIPNGRKPCRRFRPSRPATYLPPGEFQPIENPMKQGYVNNGLRRILPGRCDG